MGRRPGLWRLDFGCGLFRFSGWPLAAWEILQSSGLFRFSGWQLAAWEIWESGGLSLIDPAQARRDALHVPFWRQKGTEKPPPKKRRNGGAPACPLGQAAGRGFGSLILAAGFSVLAAGRRRLGRFGKAAGFHLQIPPRQGGMRCMFLFGVKKEPKNRRRFRRGGRTAKRGLRAPLETPGAILWPSESLKRCSHAVTV